MQKNLSWKLRYSSAYPFIGGNVFPSSERFFLLLMLFKSKLEGFKCTLLQDLMF